MKGGEREFIVTRDATFVLIIMDAGYQCAAFDFYGEQLEGVHQLYKKSLYCLRKSAVWGSDCASRVARYSSTLFGGFFNRAR